MTIHVKTVANWAFSCLFLLVAPAIEYLFVSEDLFWTKWSFEVLLPNTLAALVIPVATFHGLKKVNVFTQHSLIACVYSEEVDTQPEADQPAQACETDHQTIPWTIIRILILCWPLVLVAAAAVSAIVLVIFIVDILRLTGVGLVNLLLLVTRWKFPVLIVFATGGAYLAWIGTHSAPYPPESLSSFVAIGFSGAIIGGFLGRAVLLFRSWRIELHNKLFLDY